MTITIAVVEDNPSNMKLIVLILQRAGYAVLEACDADCGLAIIRERQPDLVLMDMHIPGTDGMEATRVLKQDTATRHIPVVALTARAMEGDRETMLAAGCDGYVSKPIRYQEVLALIEELTAGKQK
jgi:two-component system cell cycle response regulator DivK